MSNAVVVGATTGVGRALARALAAQGHNLVIVGREQGDLDALLSDLRFRAAQTFEAVPQDIADPGWNVEAFAEHCERCLGGSIDAVFVPAGGAREDDVGARSELVEPVAAVNYVGPARVAAVFGARMASRGAGVVVLVSSIAATAPRTKNAAYSAAKAALEVYGKALRHALEPRGVRIITVALGYVDTSQSFGLQLALPVASPEAVADGLIALSRGAGGHYHLPRFWWLVTTTLRLLPWPVYRHLKA